MTPAKHISLQKYLEQLEIRIAAPTPPKHASSEAEYRSYLQLELKRTKLRLESDAVVLPKAK